MLLRTAEFSKNGKYRYSLTRVWSRSLPTLYCILHNPSKAGVFKDDATVRRLVAYAHYWGFGGIIVLNLFAFRATDPKVLRRVRDPKGNANEDYIQSIANEAIVLVGWGVGADVFGPAYPQSVLRILRYKKCRIWCLGVTKNGQPKHPVRLAKKLKPKLYRRKG